MSQASPEVFNFLLTRRSRPAKMLRAPAPPREELLRLLEAAARTPDHGKLEPWRFVVLSEAALRALAQPAKARALAVGKTAEQAEKAASIYLSSPLAVMVVECERASATIPVVEQTYSAGAVCLALVNAALSRGWGANWLSGWLSHDRAFIEEHFGIQEKERIAGLIHIGTASATPPERPRPDLGKIVEWR